MGHKTTRGKILKLMMTLPLKQRHHLIHDMIGWAYRGHDPHCQDPACDEDRNPVLRDLRELYVYIEPDNPDGGPSGADTCAALYDMMGRWGMYVP